MKKIAQNGFMQKLLYPESPISFCLTVLLVLLFLNKVQATVGENCNDCHTMHNSQNGQPVAYQLNPSYSDFETNTTPNKLLLVSNCIGCHTSTGSATIINNTPIVFNTSTVNSPLAGGNFNYVRNNDANGHNINGVVSQDGNLGLIPPGGAAMTSQLTCAGEFGCHGNRNTGKDNISGIKGAHHTDDSGGLTGNSVGLSYRFLNGISGKEDPDWEQDNVNTSHNEYKGSTSNAADTISHLCAECHGMFHTWEGGVFEVGITSPWLRHPTDINLKSTGEYANYTTYSMVAPVARPAPDDVIDSSQVTPGTDIIMCLSCHRSHASPYFKMMRWDYKSPTLSTALSGCNVCHTSMN